MNPFSSSPEPSLAKYIGHLPRQSLLKYAQTEDQKAYWGHLAAFYFFVSHCWQAKLQGNDPFIEAVEDQTVNQWYYDAIWARANLLQNLWKLIESGHPWISKAFANQEYDCPFTSAPDLFCHIIEMQANYTFSRCLKPYHNVSTPERLKAWKILRKLVSTNELKAPQRKVLKSLTSQYHGNSWLLVSLAVICTVADSGNQELLQKLNDYCTAAVRDMEVTVTGLSRKRSSKNFEKFYSFTWHHGNIVPANKTGGTYSL
ncbi:hypothetical protein H6F50_17215 [Coleofasciculus sp. FACHB-712]|uniref:hypothetical protein n=1 Tax=Coleofasciculus sp. FACHB-712 TaxID=2692789 RepID=UPI001682B7F7|nr:hypothetical protein [Coleofasciculus sp. FACHB-712]MBD1944079.1 hypothetical protein [Coleofasciculus sp. FACHB-712]